MTKTKTTTSNKSKVGAVVRYCGHHNATFCADVIQVGTAVAVHTSPITDDNLNRNAATYEAADFQLTDYPSAGLWKPRLGVFVVPEDQLIDLRPSSQSQLEDVKGVLLEVVKLKREHAKMFTLLERFVQLFEREIDPKRERLFNGEVVAARALLAKVRTP